MPDCISFADFTSDMPSSKKHFEVIGRFFFFLILEGGGCLSTFYPMHVLYMIFKLCFYKYRNNELWKDCDSLSILKKKNVQTVKFLC